MATSRPADERRQNLLPSEVTENKEDIQLIWLDGNMDESDDYLLTESMLIELNPAAQFYSDFDRCRDLIKSIKDEQIFLIVSGAFARRVLEQLHTHRSLVAIFIFCANRRHHELLLREYSKIVEIFTDQDKLLESIRENMILFEKQTLAFSLFDQKQKALKNLSKESASFILHQMLIFILRQMSQDEQSKKEMIDVCRDYYHNNKRELKKITEFQNNYSRDKAIEWYTDECFIYRLLNKALRTENMELLYTFRFFIIDLCAAIEDESRHLKDKGILTLYRGTQMASEELEKLKENIDKIISTNGFLSTSRNMNVSLRFVHPSVVMTDVLPVLFEIQADPSLKTLRFADVADKSRIEGEKEVLFSLNSLFKIHSVKFDSTLDLWKVRLNATDEGAEKLEEYLTLSKREMEERSPIIYFGGLLMQELGQVDRAEKYFNMLLKSLPSDHPDIAAVYINIGVVHRKRDQLNLALKNYDMAYKIRRARLPPNHYLIASPLSNIGNIYSSKGDFDLALAYYQKALKIEEINHPGDHLTKAKVIGCIGKTHIEKGNFDIAFTHLSRALEMYKNVLPNQHLNIATCLGNIGIIRKKKGDLDGALNYYHQQLKMEEQCLPFNHPNLSTHLEWIVDMYKRMGEIEQGLKFCREKLDIQKNTLGDNHPCIAQTLMILARVLEDEDPCEARKHCEEALSIADNSTPPHYQTVTQCLTWMTCFFWNLDLLDDGLKDALRALDVNRQTLPSDHIDIANSLRNVGLYYAKMNNPVEALRYYNESLAIYRATYGLDHEKVKKVETNIAKLNDTKRSLVSRMSRAKSLNEALYQKTSPTIDFTPESQSPSSTMTNKLPTTVTSKACVIQ